MPRKAAEPGPRIKTMVEVEVKPFGTPNFIIIDDGHDLDTDSRSFSIKDADPKLLDHLCNAFREEVFAKAGKKDPRLS